MAIFNFYLEDTFTLHERRGKTAKQLFYLKSPFPSSVCGFLEFSLAMKYWQVRTFCFLRWSTVLNALGSVSLKDFPSCH